MKKNLVHDRKKFTQSVRRICAQKMCAQIVHRKCAQNCAQKMCAELCTENVRRICAQKSFAQKLCKNIFCCSLEFFLCSV